MRRLAWAAARLQPQTTGGRRVTSLADVINFGREIGALSPSVVEACRQVAEAEGGIPAEVS